jgi:hypothetical protein
MVSPRKCVGSQPSRGRRALWAALAAAGLLPAVGCQVEYAGMTLPSPHYMSDDVQYFAPGPEMKYANTVAATQRAYMRSQGLDVPESIPTGPIGAPPAGAGMLEPQQRIGNVPANANVSRSTTRPEANTVVPAPADTPPGQPGPGAQDTVAPNPFP